MTAERLLLLALFLVGFAAVAGSRNVVKKIFGLNLANSAVVLLFVVEGGRGGNAAPILDPAESAAMADEALRVVDPVPQALMLTAIVIGVCITALALALAFRLHRAFGTFDIDEIRRKSRDGE